jgi:hypothetical protein
VAPASRAPGLELLLDALTPVGALLFALALLGPVAASTARGRATALFAVGMAGYLLLVTALLQAPEAAHEGCEMIAVRYRLPVDAFTILAAALAADGLAARIRAKLRGPPA